MDDEHFAENLFDGDGSVFGDGRAVGGAGDLVDKFLADAATNLADAVLRDADDDAGGLPEQIRCLDFRGSLLAVKEPGEHVDEGGEDRAGDEADAGGRESGETVVGGDGSGSAEGGDEDGEDAGTEEAGSTLIHFVGDVVFETEVFEDFAKQDRDQEEEEAERGD